MSLNPKVIFPKYMHQVRHGIRLPVQKITVSQYTSADDVKIIIKNYEQKMLKNFSSKYRGLVIGHGRLHPKHPGLEFAKTILLDLNPIAIPDIIGDMKHGGFMSRFPKNYFHEIIIMYTPPPSPIYPGNTSIWTNAWRLLRPGGIIRSKYIMHVFLKKGINLSLAKKSITKYFQSLKLFKQIKFIKNWVYLIK